jgi:hypothetical protein
VRGEISVTANFNCRRCAKVQPVTVSLGADGKWKLHGDDLVAHYHRNYAAWFCVNCFGPVDRGEWTP